MIKDIIENNSYPIVFIGSGISKRYLEDFPTWSALLEEYWDKIEQDTSIFQFMRQLKNSPEIKTEPENSQDFLINTKTAEFIKQRFDDLFFENKIILDDLDEGTAYRKNISPFNFSIAKRFSNYSIKPEMQDEIEVYKLFLSKAKVIVTTNYDTLTEDLLNSIHQKPTIYIGQKGFFDDTYNWSELFKIHGDINDPDSIVITEEDYKRYDNNSILISAKILSNLINSPIIFLGYSLSDRNVQKLLSDFASQLPDDDIRKSSNRITVVEYSPDTDDFVEQIVNNTSLNISHSVVRTNNYIRLYQELSKINQGLTPFEVSRYESEVKKIIISAGASGKLNSFLVAPQNLHEMPEDIKKSRIVVALGDKKNMFVNPSLTNYIDDYFRFDASFLPEVALPLIANENTQARLPFVKHLKNVKFDNFDFLNKRQKEKLHTRIEKMGTLDSIIDTVPKHNKRIYDNLQEIIEMKIPNTRKLELIVFNIKKFNQTDIFDYINSSVLPVFSDNYNNSATELSAQRRLLLAYDLLKNGDIR